MHSTWYTVAGQIQKLLHLWGTWTILDAPKPHMTGPDPNSTLEFESDPVLVRHLANVGHKRTFYPSSYKLRCTPVIPSIPLAGLGDTQSVRAANWQDSGDRSQPDPLAGLGNTKSTRAANPDRSRDTKSIRAANPGTQIPGVPETREANVKCTDKTESKLDVRRHRHN
ncbi:hypothetical protein L3X38_038062 [Prunus dulcis]|uniref:Uncharacterized protein n=1 Tax=Prunus dulcis TaxID=3755 RepID=A0AAD4YRA2_PRUDU|nr:hypothetical protein L3X38_038062 [Prunus dulcis]